MATQSPFLFLQTFLEQLPLPPLRPPAWVVEEAQRNVVLLLNHVLSQESQALARLRRQQGRVVLAKWQSFEIKLSITAAGLVDRAAAGDRADLTMVVVGASPLSIAADLLRGEQPQVGIEGDVLLAAEVKWLVDHVRWDLEEDLSRLIGDGPAHALGQGARAMAQAVRSFVGAAAVPGGGGAVA